MSQAFTLRPIGTVSSTRDTPIDDDWDAIPAHIDLDPEQFDEEALMGLDAFSHCEILFLFDRVPDEKIETGARHPRGREDWPRIGIFAQRGKNRPNRIGLTTCRIVSVDGTPVLDIKPVMSGFAPRGDVREPDWAKEIMAGYW